MNKHKLADHIEHFIAVFTMIKTLSHTDRVDELCVQSIKRLRDLVDTEAIQKQLDEVRHRRIDPMV